MEAPGHKLAAIMFTDIVGYTSIMGKDESLALGLLDQNRQIHKRHIKANNGTLIKEMGDGNLVHFSSALDAVLCAKGIQEEASQTLHGKIRIGIHLDEIVIKDKDVFGDGVNIASRIQELTDPGGVFVSEPVQKAIRNHPNIDVRYLTEVTLKNVDYPLNLFALAGEDLPVTTTQRLKELANQQDSHKRVAKLSYISILVLVATIIIVWIWMPSSKQSTVRIAVLPTVDMSGETDGEFIAAGLHGPVIDELMKIGALQVISRTSSAKYKAAQYTIPEIAKALNVDMVVESELTQMSAYVNLNYRLIQAFPQEVQVWSKAYDKSTSEILGIFGDVAIEIARAINIELSNEEITELRTSKKVNPDAYKAYLTGRAHLFELTSEGLDRALKYFNLSIEKDSTFAPAYMGVAFVWGARRQQGLVPVTTAMPHIDRATTKANALDNRSTELVNDAEIHFLMGCTYSWGKWMWQKANDEFKYAIKLDSVHAEARAYYGFFLMRIHRFEEAIQQIELAMELQPYNSIVQSLYGMTLNELGQYDKAISVFSETLKGDPGYATALGGIWTAYHMKEMYPEAIEAAIERYEVRGEKVMAEILSQEYLNNGYHHAMVKLAEAYINKKDTSYVTPWQIATLYTRAQRTELALDWLEKSYIERDPNMPSLSIDPLFDQFRNEDRFVRILDEMKLPNEFPKR